MKSRKNVRSLRRGLFLLKKNYSKLKYLDCFKHLSYSSPENSKSWIEYDFIHHHWWFSLLNSEIPNDFYLWNNRCVPKKIEPIVYTNFFIDTTAQNLGMNVTEAKKKLWFDFIRFANYEQKTKTNKNRNRHVLHVLFNLTPFTWHSNREQIVIAWKIIIVVCHPCMIFFVYFCDMALFWSFCCFDVICRYGFAYGNSLSHLHILFSSNSSLFQCTRERIVLFCLTSWTHLKAFSGWENFPFETKIICLPLRWAVESSTQKMYIKHLWWINFHFVIVKSQ